MAQALSDATGQRILATLEQINATLVATNAQLGLINAALQSVLADQQKRAVALQGGAHYKP